MWVFQLILAVGLFLLQALLAPKPKGPKPGSLDELDAPKVEEGDEIPIAFGSPWINSPQVPWVGDKSFSKLVKKSSALFGLITNKQTVGFKYYAGLHFILATHLDKLLEFRVNEKTALDTAQNPDTTFTVDKPKLFGDEDREGGFTATIDFESGGASQVFNAYLSAQQTAEFDAGDPGISAYRGAAGLVMRSGDTSGGAYIGNSNFLPPFEFHPQSIYTHPEAWYPLTAAIPVGDLAASDEGVHPVGDNVLFSGHGWARPAFDFENNYAYGVDLTYIYQFDLRDNSRTDIAVNWGSEPVDNLVPFSVTHDPVTGDIYVGYRLTIPVNNFRVRAFDVSTGQLKGGSFQFFGADAGEGHGFAVGNTSMLFWDRGASGRDIYTYIGGAFTVVTGAAIPSYSNYTIISGATEAQMWLIDSSSKLRVYTITTSNITLSYTSTISVSGLVYSPSLDVFVTTESGDVVGYDMTSFAMTELWRFTPLVSALSLVSNSQNKVANRFAMSQFQLGNTHQIRSVLTGQLLWAENIHQWGSSSVRLRFDDDSGSVFGEWTAAGGSPIRRIVGPAGVGTTDYLDMNPAHILRRILYAQDNGGLANSGGFGTTWETVADTLFDELLGISILWTNPGDKDSFRKTIEDHADVLTYIDRATGLWEITAIRNDYDVGSLFTIDDTIAISWQDVSWPSPGELTNQIVVVYDDVSKADKASTAPVTNVAHVAQTGRVIQDKIDYPGFSHVGTANRKAQSLLQARSQPLVSGTVVCRYLPPTINRGDVVIVTSAKHELNAVVARITEITDGDGRDNSVRVRWVQDQFDTPLLVFDQIEIPTPIDTTALDATSRLIEEAPYEFMAGIAGKSEADTLLASDAGAGVAHAAIKKPNSQHRSFDMFADPGSGYVDAGLLEFVPAGAIQTALGKEADSDLTFDIGTDPEITGVPVPGIVAINSELMRLDSISVAGAVTTITVGRGVMDTVPAEHSIGAIAFFIDVPQFPDIQYTDADDVDFKPLTNTSTDSLDIASATLTNVVFDSRAIRPYPPGKFRLDGAYTNDTVVAAPQLTWTDRDRLDQAVTAELEDHDDGDIGPEAGTTYQVRVYAMDSGGSDLSTLIDTNVGTAKVYNYPGASLPAGTVRLRGQVWSVRDTYESWQAPSITWIPPVTADSGAVTADTDQITADNG